MIIIPYREFEPDILEAVLDEIITRDGTDYGMVELSVEQKRQQLLRRLEQGTAFICFDEETQSCIIVNKEQADFLQNP